MVQKLKEFDIREMRDEIQRLPDFEIWCRQIELSKKKDTLVAWLDNGTYWEITCYPISLGKVNARYREISRDEAIEQYVPHTKKKG